MAVFMVVTVFLTRFIPFSEFFRNVNTLVHELGHAAVTLLLKGDVMHIYLYADQSGVTYTTYSDQWMAIPISLAGYTVAALFALLLMLLHAWSRQRLGLALVAALTILGWALFVRNGYGSAWCAGFALLTILICWAPPWVRNGYYLLISFICLVESVVSSLVIVMLAWNKPSSAGDAANLSQVTDVPALAWAICFAVFSLWCAKMSVSILFKHGFGKSQRAARSSSVDS